MENPLHGKRMSIKKNNPATYVNHLEQDIIVKILDQDGNQDIGAAERGKPLIDEIYYNRTTKKNNYE